MTIASLTLDEFLTRLGSSDPTPGGGAMAAVAGALAAAMLAMTCNLTFGRPRYADVEAQVRDLLTETSSWQHRLMELADADADAYLAVRDAYGMPRGDDAERAARAEAIEHSMHGATEVPIETMEASRRLLDLALLAAELTNVNTLGDVAVAAHVATGATRAAADQARLNIANLADQEFAGAMQERISSALADADAVVARTLEAINQRTSQG
jgi:formiminotetrahydrofolate cyclodeaminase